MGERAEGTQELGDREKDSVRSVIFWVGHNHGNHEPTAAALGLQQTGPVDSESQTGNGSHAALLLPVGRV